MRGLVRPLQRLRQLRRGLLVCPLHSRERTEPDGRRGRGRVLSPTQRISRYRCGENGFTSLLPTRSQSASVSSSAP